MEEFLNRLALAIRDARTELGYTQETLAEKIAVSPETISHFERCRTVPSLRTLFTLAEELKLDLAGLLEDADQGSTAEYKAREALAFATRDLTAKEIAFLVDVAAAVKRAR